MTERDNILQELAGLNSSLGQAIQPVYRVPEGYFDTLPALMLKRIKTLDTPGATEEIESLSPLLAGISKRMPYTVPAGYFDNPGRVQDNDTADEPAEWLSGLKEKATYTVPSGYFEQLPVAILQKVNASRAKIVPLTARKWFRYAAAASVIVFLAVLGFVFSNRETVDPDTKSYAWVKKNMKKVSTDEIAEFVELASQETNQVVKAENGDDLSKLLSDVSDKEIQDFLNETLIAETPAEDDLILN